MTLLRALTLALVGLLLALPAQARDPFDDPVTARVIPGWTLPDGRQMAALELVLDPGWKTYWRSPGDAGIPPQFDWSASRNLSNVQVTWPTPKVFHQNGMRSIGYTDRVIVPLTISARKAGKPVRLRGDMILGVCADVCMPHRLKFDAMLSPGDTRPVPAIAAALAQTPYSPSEAGVKAATCRLTPTGDGMKIEVRVQMPSAGGREVAVIEPGLPGIWISESDTSRSGDWIVAASEMIHDSDAAFSINRSAVRITILGQSHAVDIQGCTPG